MDFACNYPFFTIMILMFAGIITPIFGAKAAKVISITALSIGAVLSALLTVYTMQTGGRFTYMVGHFPAPFGNEISAGALEAVMALGFCVVTLLSVLASGKTTDEDVPENKRSLFYVMINMLVASLLVLVYTNDLFTAYVFVEINTIAACAIVMSKPGGETIVATIRYLIMSLIGSGLFLFAISLIYDLTGHLLMEPMKTSVGALMASGNYHLPLVIVAGLFAVSMAIKSALYPFHSWLPDAHGSATTASSSILSGLVLKGYIILLIKLMYRVLGWEVAAQLYISPVMLVLGLLGMIMGSIQAMRQTNIKRMIAYSSVAQIGYIYMGIGFGTTAGMVAACFHILAHMVTKPMLFTAAGGMIHVSGHKKSFEHLRGAAYRDPLAGAAFVVGSLSMIGIPLFSGFISKFYFATASIDSAHTVAVLAVLTLSTVLNALYYIPAIAAIYSKPATAAAVHGEHGHGDAVQTADPLEGVIAADIGSGAAVQTAPALRYEKSINTSYTRVSTPWIYRVCLVAFIVLNFVLGIFSAPILRALEVGLSVFG